MTTYSFAAACVLVLFVFFGPGQTSSIPNSRSQDVQYIRSRERRAVDKEFVCLLPINLTANEPYINCGIINETQTEFGIPATLSEKYRPRFEYAVMCSNDTLEESDEADDDASISESEEHEDDSDEESCLRDPFDDCAVQCVYQETNVLNEQGLPEAERLYEHVMNLLDQDSALKPAVKEAVWNCHKELMKTVHDYGLERLDQCLLLETIDECMEYEIGLRCPKTLRLPYKKSRE